MALKATIFKADVLVSDMDHSYFQSHSLTLARHPSETSERMMIRLLAFGLNAHISLNDEPLQFTKGLSTDSEPDLWLKSLSDEIKVWIEVGLPDEKRIRKGCNRADKVIVYAYGERTAPLWWKNIKTDLDRFDNLDVYYLRTEDTAAITDMAERNMSLQATIQDDAIWFGSEENTLMISPQCWKNSDTE